MFSMKKILKGKGLFVAIVMMFVFLVGCGGQEGTSSQTSSEPAPTNTDTQTSTPEAPAPEPLEEIKLVLNWFPKSQQGGFYAAKAKGFFEENGLDVTLEPGGPQVSSIQIVASGNAQFGLAHADQLIIARNQGIELVAIAASLQKSPAAFMFHEGVEINDFEDLNGRTVFIQPGITYWEYLKSKYDMSGVNELAYNGQHVNFLADTESVTQAFVTSEPYFLEREGIKTGTKMISDSGFDPYNVVLYATRDYIEKNPATVQKLMNAFVEGWAYYKDAAEEINEVIHEANPNIALEELLFETNAQFDIVYGDDAATYGVGYMTEERWALLIDQLSSLGLLEKEVDAKDVFTTEFLPTN